MESQYARKNKRSTRNAIYIYGVGGLTMASASSKHGSVTAVSCSPHFAAWLASAITIASLVSLPARRAAANSL